MTSSTAYDFWINGDGGSLLITINQHAECAEDEMSDVSCYGTMRFTHSTDLLINVAITYNYDLLSDYMNANVGAGVSIHSICDPYHFWCSIYGVARDIATIGGPAAGRWTLNGQVYIPAGEPFLLGYGAATAYRRGAGRGLGMADGTIQFTIQPAPHYAKGDANCDGAVTPEDVSVFIQGMLSPYEYRLADPACDPASLDMNDDGVVNGSDIGLFTQALVPE